MALSRIFALYLVVVCVVGAIYASTQPVVSYKEGIFLDAEKYHGMTRAFIEDRTPETAAPFIHRIALPWMVAQCCAERELAGFKGLNVLFGMLSALVVLVLSRRIGAMPWAGFLASLAFISAIHGPVRLNSFYPILTDAALLFFSSVLLYLLLEPKKTGWALLCTAGLLTMVGVLFRESVAVVALAGFLAALWRYTVTADIEKYKRLAISCLPLVGGILVYLVILNAIQPPHPRYYLAATTSLVGWYLDHPLALLLTPLVGLGPVVLLLAIEYRIVLQFARRYPILPIYALLVLGLVCAGGYHGIRIVFWSAVAVYPMCAFVVTKLYQTLSKPRFVSLVLLLLVSQAVAMHVFGDIPDMKNLAPGGEPVFYLLFPYGSAVEYPHLDPNNMPEWGRLTLFAQYMVVFLSLALLRFGRLESRQ